VCALRGLIDFTAEGGEARSIQDPRSGVPDFLHGEMNPADRLVAAVGAGDVGGLAGAGNWGERSIKHANDLTEIDLRRIPGEQISPSLPLPAAENSLVAKPEENQLEEFWGNLLGASEVGDANGLAWFTIGEGKERFDSVLRLAREHTGGSLDRRRRHYQRSLAALAEGQDLTPCRRGPKLYASKQPVVHLKHVGEAFPAEEVRTMVFG
jgi:hypothetical protein